MTLKNLMLGTAVAALFAGPALAQDDTTEGDTEATTEMSTDTEAQAESGAESEGEVEGEMEMAEDAEVSSDAESSETAEGEDAEGDMAAEGESDMAAEGEGDMAADGESNMSAEGEGEMAAEGDMSEDAATGEGDGMSTDMTEGDTGMAEEGQPTSIAEMTVGEFIGLVVFSPEDERIGEIDYVVEQDGGLAGVIGIGGFLGLAEYTVAIPIEEFQLREEGDSLGLDATRDALRERPEFDETGVEGLEDDVVLGDMMESEEGSDS
ncbi:putative sodium/potassium/calcium exchanger [Histidinibacterium aquaticum]|uniref:PRC-barrel domain-containing protein n=1 Tax=Histidinibacterium aquaticum TaxID=2613962 RepID=A0A5J5GET0_9RHOB|nr:hypothetical protein [Histidinibacterium aquaticum]KAA9006756.1 hypothetical protein F3S47_13330 [Histidinibacterium aquaticum]